MHERNLVLTLSYDGTDFNGWQIQASGRTVQGVLEHALHKRHSVLTPVIPAGRTDAGVHAVGQRAGFRSPIDSIPVERYPAAINSLLPRDVRVTDCREVAADFHARYDVISREYRYYILPAAIADPCSNRYAWGLSECLDLRQMNRLAGMVVGEHDYAGFAVRTAEVKSTVRHVFSAGFFPEGRFVVFRIVATGFLWRMVRSLVGSIVTMHKEQSDIFVETLRSGVRPISLESAPAQGLFFHRVRYKHES